MDTLTYQGKEACTFLYLHIGGLCKSIKTRYQKEKVLEARKATLQYLYKGPVQILNILSSGYSAFISCVTI